MRLPARRAHLFLDASREYLRTLVGDAIGAIVPPGKRAAFLTELAH
ncbi:MAG: hypothetical protein ACREPU_07725 [Rhodanobacteraceae bacterium]